MQRALRQGRLFPHAGRVVPLLLEWLALELLGHVGLIAMRQLCGTWWSWRTGGPFAYLDISRAMLQGDFWWVVAVVGTSALRSGLLAEWGHWLAPRRTFHRLAWLPWLAPGCLLGWVILIRGDSGVAYILGLRAGFVFEGYHILFFGYVAARIGAAALQLAAGARLLLRHSRRALAAEGPWPRLPLGVAMVAVGVLICGMVYLHIYQRGGSYTAEWPWFSRPSHAVTITNAP